MESSKHESSSEKPLSFTELQKKEHVSYDELKTTLGDYAYSGSSILADVVISIIDRIELTEKQLFWLTDLAKTGVVMQGQLNFQSDDPTVLKEQNQYRKIVDHILVNKIGHKPNNF